MHELLKNYTKAVPIFRVLKESWDWKRRGFE